MSDKRQKNQLAHSGSAVSNQQMVLAFLHESRSEAPRVSEEGTESLAVKRGTESPAFGEQLMEEVCERENCKQALARVKANKGSPGGDGMTVQQLPEHLKQHWPAIRKQLLSGTYKPQPVKGGNPQAGRRSAQAWHSNGAGSVYPAGGDAGTVTQMGPDVFRLQPRVSARTLGASGGRQAYPSGG